MLSRLGLQAETLLDRLPTSLREGLNKSSERALWMAARVARQSHRLPPQPRWAETGLTAGLGALGGVGGVTATAAEIPATVTLLLRRIQQVGAAHGFDPRADNVAFDSLRVFADSGPLTSDDGADAGFLSVRLAASGETLFRMVQVVAPRLAVAMGKKAALQVVPVLGAAAGAGVNLLYTRHYDIVSQVHFGLRRLAADTGLPVVELEAALLSRMHPSR